MDHDRLGRGVRLALLFSTLALSSCDSDDDDARPVDDEPANGGDPDASDPEAGNGFDATFASLDCAELTAPEVLEAVPALADPAFTCGRVAVPADWDVPDGDTIDLAVYRLASTGDSPALDPIVFLTGGPGQAALAAAPAFLEGGPVDYLLERSDVIVVDQRGTGFSTPSLVCPEALTLAQAAAAPFTDKGAFAPDDFAQLRASREALPACAERLVAENGSLAGYTTADNALDIAAVREALDIDEWNLFGGSYGTALALTVLRERPEGVRSVILDSAVPPQSSLLKELSYSSGYQPLSQIVTNCSADADCAAEIGDMRALLETGLARLARAPVGQLTAERYLQLLSTVMADPGVPRLATTVAGGSDEEIAELVDEIDDFLGDDPLPPIAELTPALLRLAFDADLMFAAIVCAEEVPFPRSDVSPELSADFDETTRRIVESYTAPPLDAAFCERLGVMPADAAESEPVASDVPALVLAGDADAQTPPIWSETVAETLSRSQYLEFPGAGHIVTFEEIDCAAKAVLAFLDDPETELDRSCVDALPLVDYGTGSTPDEPSEADTELLEFISIAANGFLQAAQDAAAAPVEPPDIVVDTTPSLAFYDGEGTVVLSRWEELDDEGQALFERWAAASGGAFDGRTFFAESFNWFLVAHEIAHYLQDESGRGPATRWDTELQANEMAVAYFGAVDRARLDAYVGAVRRVLDILPVPEGGTDRAYFEREYDRIGDIPEVYGYFQFGFILDAYERIDELDLATIVGEDLGL